MADQNIGDDSLLTKTLEPTDRVTITRATTGQTLGTMTVEDFMKHCARLMPVATATTNGVMSPAQAAQVPTGGGAVYSRRTTVLRIPDGKKARVHLNFDTLADDLATYRGLFVRITAMHGDNDWDDASATIKSASISGSATRNTWRVVGSRIERLTYPGYIYVGNLQSVRTGVRYHRDVYFDIVRKINGIVGASGTAALLVDTYSRTTNPTTLTVELLDATDEERALSNADEL